MNDFNVNALSREQLLELRNKVAETIKMRDAEDKACLARYLRMERIQCLSWLATKHSITKPEAEKLYAEKEKEIFARAVACGAEKDLLNLIELKKSIGSIANQLFEVISF